MNQSTRSKSANILPADINKSLSSCSLSHLLQRSDHPLTNPLQRSNNSLQSPGTTRSLSPSTSIVGSLIYKMLLNNSSNISSCFFLISISNTENATK